MKFTDSFSKELVKMGFTELEARGASILFSEIAQAERLWADLETNEIITSILFDGIEEMNVQQKTLVEGVLTLTDKEKDCYYWYIFDELSICEIARILSCSTTVVYNRLENARGKLAAAKNGVIDWKNDKRISSVLSKLTEQRRDCFIYRYRKGMNTSEIAIKMDISVNTVKYAISQAKTYIHLALVDEY